MHRSLINDYRNQGGVKRENCEFIAIEVAVSLLEEGKTPSIVSITKNGNGATGQLKPVIYQGRIVWGCHFVACCGGQAYDPMLGIPVPLDKYSQIAFGENIPLRTEFSQEDFSEWQRAGIEFLVLMLSNDMIRYYER